MIFLARPPFSTDRSTIMKTICVLTAAALTVLGFLTSHAEAQDFAPANRPPAFGPNPQAPRRDDKQDRQHFGSASSWIHALPHGHPGAVPGSGLPEKTCVKPAPAAIPPEVFYPRVPEFKVPASLPEISVSQLSVPREGWFRSASGSGVAGAGGIAGLFAALFGRKKNTDS
jgi:hypothetical protein